MAWFKIDDKLWGHPKWLATPARSRALWTTAGSWSAANETDGKIPRHVIAILGGSPRDATALCDSGLWREVKAGWIFHEWSIYQPDAASLKAKRKSEVDGGLLGNHKRWHVGRSVTVPDCEYCQGMPPDDDIEPSPPDGVPEGLPESPPNRPEPEPEPDGFKKVSRGGLVSSDAINHPPQICGRSHDPETNCRACGEARAAAKTNAVDAETAKARRQREASASESRARRQADEDERNTIDTQAAKTAALKARQALKAAKEEL